ncbi:PREDICTED: uncharacterized protein LOC109478536 [Branchiostoma belcheri]|uniref:Uncharacterized protein LOC109478536 n=1 Tax=Branchiostoma belcheri TaxID=7741 RepID=A0A6P5A1Q6_BRABE|nr:PREDICTED: uncharacterized protein LOC109478536 [Branchiostoma belcheri]
MDRNLGTVIQSLRRLRRVRRETATVYNMFAWLKRANPSLKPSTTPGLPNPMDTKNPEATAAANREVERVIAESASRKRKRGTYGHYSPEMRAKIARVCVEVGASKAARRLSAEVGRELNESTVRSIKNSYTKELKRLGKDSIENFPRKNTGRPLMLGDLDDQLKEYTQNLRRAGGVVNRLVVQGAARGLVARKDRSLLVEHGGHIRISKPWANSFLRRMNFVKRKGTKAARKVPQDFDQTRDDFHQRIEDIVRENDIPDELVVNWDQTGINVVPVGGWTLAEEGSRQVCLFACFIDIFICKTVLYTLLMPVK